jgi:hypothetical protein
MKANKPKTVLTKRTYSHSQLPLLLVQESFKRDLPLFKTLMSDTGGFFGLPYINKDWTFTILYQEDGSRELVINVPQKKKS